MSERPLCRIDELDDPGSKGLAVEIDGRMTDIFVVRRGDEVFAYVNRCPHTGSPLDWLPDRFLDLDCSSIQCATHDARFRIEDGFCFSGPCQGDYLQRIVVQLRDGAVWMV